MTSLWKVSRPQVRQAVEQGLKRLYVVVDQIVVPSIGRVSVVDR
jgi:hypothetical protein